MEARFEYSSVHKDNYFRYVKEHPGNMVSYKQWMKIIGQFNDLFREYLLQTGERDKLPFGLGALTICKKKTIRTFVSKKDGVEQEHTILPIDWKASREAGKRVFILNTHSDGYRFKWKWFRNDSNIKWAILWNFKPSGESSKLINTYVNDEDGLKFIEKWKEWERII